MIVENCPPMLCTGLDCAVVTERNGCQVFVKFIKIIFVKFFLICFSFVLVQLVRQLVDATQCHLYFGTNLLLMDAQMLQ